jgi:hypothetical protein
VHPPNCSALAGHTPAELAARNGHFNLAAYLSIAAAAGQSGTVPANNLFDQVNFDPTEPFDPNRALLVLKAVAACSSGKPLKPTGLLAALANKAPADDSEQGIIIGSKPRQPAGQREDHRSAPLDSFKKPSPEVSCSCLCFCGTNPASVVVEIKRSARPASGNSTNSSRCDLGTIIEDPLQVACEPMLKYQQRGSVLKSPVPNGRNPEFNRRSSISESHSNPGDAVVVLKPGVWLFRIFGAVTVAVWALYLVWRSIRTLNPGLMYFYSIPVLLVEVLAWLNNLMFVLNCWCMVSSFWPRHAADVNLLCHFRPVIGVWFPKCVANRPWDLLDRCHKRKAARFSCDRPRKRTANNVTLLLLDL